MNVVDSSGRLGHFAEGTDVHFFVTSIRRVADPLVPTICIHEVFKRPLATVREESALRHGKLH